MLHQSSRRIRFVLIAMVSIACVFKVSPCVAAGAGIIKVFSDGLRPVEASIALPLEVMPIRFKGAEAVSKQLMKAYRQVNSSTPPFVFNQKQKALKESLVVFVGKKRLSAGVPAESVTWLSDRFFRTDSIVDFSRRAFGVARVEAYAQRLRDSSDLMMALIKIQLAEFSVDLAALKTFKKEWGASAQQLAPLCEKVRFRQQLKQDIDRAFLQVRRRSSSGYMAALGPVLERELNAQLKWGASQWIGQLPPSLSKRIVQLQRFSVEDGKITAELVSVCGLSSKVTFHSWGEPLKMTTDFDGTYAITPELNKALLKNSAE